MRDNLPWHWPYPEGEAFWEDEHWNEEDEKKIILREWEEMIVWKKEHQRHRMLSNILGRSSSTYVRWEYSDHSIGLAKRVSDKSMHLKAHYYSELPEQAAIEEARLKREEVDRLDHESIIRSAKLADKDLDYND